MKGVILAGGQGLRLRPLTLVTNKHLLPVHDRPMIHYPVQTLVEAGIVDIMVVTGGDHGGRILDVLGDGRPLGARRIEYARQEGERGIADALRLARGFAGGDKVCVILGDNLIGGSIRSAADRFRAQATGARLLLKEVADPERFGVARLDAAGSAILEILEKPAHPPSSYAVTGIYFYDADVFGICDELQPSARGELEITDVNNAYLRRGDLTHEVLDGWWIDAGTFDSLLRASQLVADSSRSRQAEPGAVPGSGRGAD